MSEPTDSEIADTIEGACYVLLPGGRTISGKQAAGAIRRLAVQNAALRELVGDAFRSGAALPRNMELCPVGSWAIISKRLAALSQPAQGECKTEAEENALRILLLWLDDQSVSSADAVETAAIAVAAERAKGSEQSPT